MPLPEFEQRFFRIRREVLRHAPRYCTVVISRRGLQTKFPEDLLAKDIMAAMEILNDVARLAESKPQGEEERYLARHQSFACRALVLGSFNLIEAYLNGLA